MELQLGTLDLIDPELLFWGPGAAGSLLIDLIDLSKTKYVDLGSLKTREDAFAYSKSLRLAVYSFCFDDVFACARIDESTHFLSHVFNRPEAENWERLNPILWRASGSTSFINYIFHGGWEVVIGKEPTHYQLRLSHDVFDVMNGGGVRLFTELS